MWQSVSCRFLRHAGPVRIELTPKQPLMTQSIAPSLAGSPQPEHAALAYTGSTVLVTGGAGSIGSNLTRALAAHGAARILVLDDLTSAVRWNVPDHPAVRFAEGSVLDDGVLGAAFAEKPDFVFHLAVLFANQNSVDHPEQDLLVNGLGTLKVLEYAHAPACGGWCTRRPAAPCTAFLTTVPPLSRPPAPCAACGRQATTPVPRSA
jgi:NAD-dependent epimerase/dehydratase family protein